MEKAFRAAKFCSTAALALGTTALASLLGTGTARAFTADTSCSTVSTSVPGGNTLQSPASLGSVCELGGVDNSDQTIPAYWEFTWNGSASLIDVSAAVSEGVLTQGSFVGSFYYTNNFSGTLSLFDVNDDKLASADFNSSSFSGTSTASIDYNLSPGSEYIVGIAAPGVDPPVTVSFTDAPEPTSLGIFGSAIAALGWFRKRRKKSG